MDKAKIFLEDGVEKLVDCLFYLYNSKYYFLYTENEKDENGYVRLYLAKVGKETTTTSNGVVETGNMVGIEVPTDEEWKDVQGSISKIVSSKKNKTEDKDIQYLPVDMLKNLKIVSKKTFKLLATIIENDFGVSIDSTNESQQMPEASTITESSMDSSSEEKSEESQPSVEEKENDAVKDQETNNDEIDTNVPQEEKEISSNENEDDFYNQDIIIDYRTKFFEEQEKNKNLTEEIEKLKNKLNSIDEIIKGD